LETTGRTKKQVNLITVLWGYVSHSACLSPLVLQA